MVLHEDESSKYFYFIKDGEFELSKKIIKNPTSDQKQEAFIDDEQVRIQDLTHGVNRYTNQVLNDRNYFYEGDSVGIIGPNTVLPEIKWFTEDLIKQRVNQTREQHNRLELHQRYKQSTEEPES